MGISFSMQGTIVMVSMRLTSFMSFPLHSVDIFSFTIMVSMRLACFMSFSFHSAGFSFSITILMSMRLASFMSFPPHSAGSSFRMHGLIFLVNMTLAILMVSFPPHSAGSSFRMHGLIFLMNMTFSILMVSFPLHSAGIFTFIIMSMRLSSFMSFSLHPVLVLVTGMIGMMGMTIYI